MWWILWLRLRARELPKFKKTIHPHSGEGGLWGLKIAFKLFCFFTLSSRHWRVGFSSYHYFFLISKNYVNWPVWNIRPMDQILCQGKNLHGASGWCVVARDQEQECGTSGISDWDTSVLVVCQRPRKCHPCANAAFHRYRQDQVTTLIKWPFVELPPQCLAVVGNLRPTFQAHQMQLYRYIAFGRLLSLQLSIATGRPVGIPYRSQMMLKTWAFSWIVPSTPSIAEWLLPT